MEQDIRDIKGPVDVAFELGLWFWLLLGGLLLAAAVFAYWWNKRRQKACEVIMPPAIPPEVEALEALSRLAMLNLPEQGKVQAYYFRLSAIVRHYLERRFSVPASEQTTEEFLGEMAQSEIFSVGQKKTVKSFMEQSDLVKFAKHQASVKQCQDGDQFARKLIKETKGSNEL